MPTSRRRSPARWLVISVLGGLAFGATQAQAEPLPASSGATPAQVLLLAERSELTDATELLTAVRSQLTDTPVTVELRMLHPFPADSPQQLAAARRVAAPGRAVAVFFLRPGPEGEPLLHLIDPQRGRLLVRSLPISPEGRAMTAAVIVAMGVRALLAGGRIDVQPRPAPRPRAAPRPSPRPLPAPARRPRAVRPVVEAGYALHASDTRHAPVHGARLALGLELPRGFGVYLAYALESPHALEGRLSSARLSRYPLTALATHTTWVRRIGLGLGLGLLLDYTTVEVAPGPGYVAVAAAGDVHVAALVVGRLGVALASRVALHLFVGAEIPFLRHRYGVLVGATREVLLTPAPVQPVLGMGVTVGLH